MSTIDLRSDTVTLPSKPMMDAMMTANVGDDVYGEDPTVNQLEDMAAKIMGKEDAIFCTSGTQSNLLGLLSHCQRGEEYIVGQLAHTYKYEAGGAAVLGSIQPQPLDFEPDGTLDLEKVLAFIKPDDYHFARTKLLCLENTQGGKVLPLDYLQKAKSLTDKHGLLLHLDGARIFNAAVKLSIDVKEITQYFDTISFCLSKGLGAPIGSLLTGKKEVIKRARRWRKMLGGGMRQAGILAAAGIYALENNIQRLATDHKNAKALANGLANVDKIQVKPELVQTNIIFLHIEGDMGKLTGFLKDKGIIIGKSNELRMVTHLDISDEDVDYTVAAFKEYFGAR
ncbi:MAG: low-specificity L-threonine aldolase [Desulfobacteraceae bacterium]|nr:low-specificity L-threonine aldolase [Desulfobacteraceae bacterium]